MFKEVINDLVTLIQTVTSIETGSVFRGEVGKVNLIKKNGVIIMPDFDIPDTLTGDRGEYSKSLPFIATCFICVAKKATLHDAEDDALDLLAAIIDKVSGTEAVIDMNGNQKYFHWEFKRAEWHDRSASLTVISCDFFLNIQV